MRTGRPDYRREAFSPWRKQSLLPRTVHPFAVALAGATEIQAAPASDISPSDAGASFTIPFLPFDILPLGSVAVSDTHRDTRKETTWVTRDGSFLT